jgi:hypothetical protein
MQINAIVFIPETFRLIITERPRGRHIREMRVRQTSIQVIDFRIKINI